MVIREIRGQGFLASILLYRRFYAYSKSEEETMKLKYTYVIDDGFYVGHLDDYPEYTTQGENLKDFEDALKEIYDWILDGTLEVKEHKGVLEVAG
ncbi:MAG: hypothetical protein LBO04_03025 [Spirochaetaceae bacterium]|nr:hypothetical protein [Spirochaetaceae bacterium]